MFGILDRIWTAIVIIVGISILVKILREGTKPDADHSTPVEEFFRVRRRREENER